MSNPEIYNQSPNSLSEKFNGLQPRERVLLVGAAIIILIMVIFTVFNTLHQDMEKQKHSAIHGLSNTPVEEKNGRRWKRKSSGP